LYRGKIYSNTTGETISLGMIGASVVLGLFLQK